MNSQIHENCCFGIRIKAKEIDPREDSDVRNVMSSGSLSWLANNSDTGLGKFPYLGINWRPAVWFCIYAVNSAICGRKNWSCVVLIWSVLQFNIKIIAAKFDSYLVSFTAYLENRFIVLLRVLHIRVGFIAHLHNVWSCTVSICENITYLSSFVEFALE